MPAPRLIRREIMDSPLCAPEQTALLPHVCFVPLTDIRGGVFLGAQPRPRYGSHGKHSLLDGAR
jgi:hypothetical protein